MICNTVKYAVPEKTIKNRILELLPEKYHEAYNKLTETEKRNLSEIRIRADSPCSFTSCEKNIIMQNLKGNTISSTTGEIAEITEKICEGSVYSYSEQIKQGYIPYYGTRIGVCGKGTVIDGSYVGQRKITSLSFRIPSFEKNAADKVFKHIISCGFENSMGILAVSPPNCGKTTFLRALAMKLSDSGESGLSKKVCVIDERGELYDKAMMKNCFCDVLYGIPKMYALEMAVRTMSPQAVIFDEIGNEEQTELLCGAYSGGVQIAASVHGNSLSDVLHSNGIKKAISKGVFRTMYLMKENAAFKDGEIIDLSNGELL